MGPFCRCAADCALVYDALRGRDPADVASQDLPLADPFAVNVTGLAVGVLPSAQDSSVEVPPGQSAECMRPRVSSLEEQQLLANVAQSVYIQLELSKAGLPQQ